MTVLGSGSERRWPLDGIDPLATLRSISVWPTDPSTRLAPGRFEWAVVTPAGAGRITVTWSAGEATAAAWGAGAGWLLDHLPDLLGAADDPSGFTPSGRLVAGLHRRFPGLRIPRTGVVWPTLVQAVLGQRVTTREASASWAGLVRRFGRPAPGPPGLVLPPGPEVLAGVPYWALHRLDVERRRADTIRLAARRATGLEDVVRFEPEAARLRLQAVPGIGLWTAAEVVARSHGDADTVLLGDAGLPGVVGWALAGEPDADDERMVELLEPYRGHRWRVVRLLYTGGVAPPRRRPLPPPVRLRGW
ncbi:MAG: DNA-3-methyladenine glycosylase 2 family protein [Acidimicrobiales bacterium]|nr:DNA-3-methyladenine glycosylase 2 family protein [Acidimicrobiales bacterium]